MMPVRARPVRPRRGCVLLLVAGTGAVMVTHQRARDDPAPVPAAKARYFMRVHTMVVVTVFVVSTHHGSRAMVFMVSAMSWNSQTGEAPAIA